MTRKQGTASPEQSAPDHTPVVPREFITRPFFPARQIAAPRVIEYKGATWTIGASRLDGRGPMPSFDMRHGRVCFALLTFRERLTDNQHINFSINELAYRVAHSNGGRYCRDLINILYDLGDTWVRIDHPDGSFDKFRIVESIRIHGKPARRRDALRAANPHQELWLDFVHLNPTFFGLLRHYQHLARFRLDVLTSMSSDAAQAIYCFLPSRAVYRSSSDPFEIRLATLMEQIGLTVPKHKSRRRERFTQRHPSIIAQLDGVQATVGTLRVQLAETNDRTDYKLQAWIEEGRSPVPARTTTSTSSLLNAWRETGRSKQQFDRCMRKRRPLSPYARDLLGAAGINYSNSETFLEMAAALLGENRFHMEISEARADALEGRQVHNPIGRLTWRLLEAVRNLPPPG